MIAGKVDERLQPRLTLVVRDRNQKAVQIEAIVDTGFTGFLTLRPTQIAQLGLLPAGSREAQLGDGHFVTFLTYVATAAWHDVERTVVILESAAENLVGMSLLRGSRLTLDAVEGGEVSVVPLR